MPRNRKTFLEGQRFGYLTVVSFVEDDTTRSKYLVRCDCGNEKIILTQNLTNGNTKSCGCKKGELVSNGVRSHGLSTSRIYQCYKGMRFRCKANLPSTKSYEDVEVCEEWSTFDGFYKDMGSTYKDGLSLERINPFGNYAPGNCKWIPRPDQQKNKRKTVFVDYDGERVRLMDLCERFNQPYDRVFHRVFTSGHSLEYALTTPIDTRQSKANITRANRRALKLQRNEPNLTINRDSAALPNG